MGKKKMLSKQKRISSVDQCELFISMKLSIQCAEDDLYWLHHKILHI